MRFEVPYNEEVRIGETFGTVTEGSTEVVFDFTPEKKLVSISGYATFTGVGGVTLSSLDQACVVEEVVVAKE